MSDVIIRELKEQDWQDYKAMRLQALQECPGVYLGRYEDAVEYEDVRWQNDIKQDNSIIFGLFDKEAMVGLAAVFTWREDPTGKTAIFAMDYIAPDYRGQGLTKLVYQSRIDWARAQNRFDKMCISHREGNEPSRRAMVAHGFQYIEKEMIDWPDGTQDFEYNYEIDV